MLKTLISIRLRVACNKLAAEFRPADRPHPIVFSDKDISSPSEAARRCVFADLPHLPGHAEEIRPAVFVKPA